MNCAPTSDSWLLVPFFHAVRNTRYEIRDKSLTIKADFDILTKKIQSLSLTDNRFSKISMRGNFTSN